MLPNVEVIDLAPGIWIWRLEHPGWRSGVDWQQVVTAGSEQGPTFLALPSTDHVPLLGARAALGDQGYLLYVVRRLDAALAQTISGRVGARFSVET